MLRKKRKQMGAFALVFCILSGALQLPAEEAKADTALEAFAAGLTEPEISRDGSRIIMPELEGAGIRFCADYEQIIGEDGTIYKPLETRTVKGIYEITGNEGTDSEETVKSAEFSITIEGQYEDQGGNQKPDVIPELQEWHGATGNFYIASFSRIIIGNEEFLPVAEEFAKDYRDITGFDLKVKSGAQEEAGIGDFYFSLTSDQGLGKEGYTMEIDDVAVVEAETATGAYWATRTILQILKQTNGSIPKGAVRDYPKYEVRAFSLDVARKPFTMEALYAFAKNMSWYKMNSFQVHLSDNLIFLEDYTDIDDAIEHAYAGFRLESGLKNEEGETVTSTDLYYSKDEFRSFIQDCRVIGVDIVPELDMPAHALPITRTFPEYMTKTTDSSGNYIGRHRIDELDLSNPNAVTLAKKLWADYFDGENPVFDEDTTVHIGTDEFHGVEGTEGEDLFLAFTAELTEYIQDRGRDVRMWGSFSAKKGTGNVSMPSKDVQLNIWSMDYVKPDEMYAKGFDLINTLDSYLYMVPDGTGRVGVYTDYLDTQALYNVWQANTISNYTVPAGDGQMLGACFALWHDNIDTRANGISQYDSFCRFMNALPAISAKTWGKAEDKNYTEFMELADEMGTAPNTNMYADVDFLTSTIAEYTFEDTDTKKDSSINGYDLAAFHHAEIVNSDSGKALQLNGGKSYAETPLDQVGDYAVIQMKVKMDADADTENSEQILCESKEPFGQEIGTYAIKASMKQTGKVGFSREGYDYSFNYELPKDGTWVELEFHSGQGTAALYVNGKLADNAPKMYYSNHEDLELNAKVATMMVPIGRIGSNTDSFKGQIAYVTVTGSKEIKTEREKVPHSEMTATACSEADESESGKEGPARFAIDDTEDTYWHSDWSTDTELNEEHHWFLLTLNDPTEIDRLTYLPRQDSDNGRIYEYSIIVEDENGRLTTAVDHGIWADNSGLKTAAFPAVNAKKVKLQIHDSKGDGVGDHATIAELNLYKPIDLNEVKTDLNHCLDMFCSYDESDFTDASWKAYRQAKEEAEQILNYSGSTGEDYLSAYEQIQQAEADLIALNETEKEKYRLAAALYQAEEQLTNLVAEAEQKLLNTAGYTAASVQALRDAINAANVLLNNPDASLGDITNALTTIQDKMNLVAEQPSGNNQNNQENQNNQGDQKDQSAQGGSSDNEAAGLKDHDTFEEGGMKYEVISASAKTVKLVKGKDTGNVTINTVSKDGTKYTVVEIGSSAFKGCKKKLKKVTIGANVAAIGKNAFKNCKKLTTVVIKGKSKLKKVGTGAFKQTAKKVSVKLPNNLKKNTKIKNQLKKAGIKKIK